MAWVKMSGGKAKKTYLYKDGTSLVNFLTGSNYIFNGYSTTYKNASFLESEVVLLGNGGACTIGTEEKIDISNYNSLHCVCKNRAPRVCVLSERNLYNRNAAESSYQYPITDYIEVILDLTLIKLGTTALQNVAINIDGNGNDCYVKEIWLE